MALDPVDARAVPLAERVDPGRQVGTSLSQILVEPDLDARRTVPGRLQQIEQDNFIPAEHVRCESHAEDVRDVERNVPGFTVTRTGHRAPCFG